MGNNILYVMGIVAGLWLARNVHEIFLGLPDEAAQGAIYRILFFHLPSWFTCFTAFLLAGVSSILYLTKKNLVYDTFAVSAVEVGTVFTVVGLTTGSIWARIIWGIWWTWDPRLTWALITCIIYAGYLMLRRAIDDPTARAKNSAVLCIFAFASVVITYKAIDWWRTQHPGAVLSFRTGGGRMDPAMESILYQNFFALLLLTSVLVVLRMRQEAMSREIEGLRRHAHAL
ncbi:MAG: cytochrome c biogenesis protein CcsA [Candidatus Solibacter usitatus]|nr:cytochrome c biogenesis protein CcsA [Candidatus Solibacter usitatus]